MPRMCRSRKKPELKIPTTRKRLYLGTMPNGVSSPCGLVTSTTEPTVAPSSSAMSLPRMIGGMAATRSARGKIESATLCVADAVRVVRSRLSVAGVLQGSLMLGALGISAVQFLRASADPIFTELSRSLTLRSYFGIIPFSTRPARTWPARDQHLLIDRRSGRDHVRLLGEPLDQRRPVPDAVALHAQQVDVRSRAEQALLQDPGGIRC